MSEKTFKYPSLILALAAGSTLMACGGGGGGGGGPSSDAKAALAGVAALSIAQTGVGLASDAEEDQDFKSLSKATEEVECDSGSQTITDDVGPGPSGDQASPYHDGSFTRTTIAANNCRVSFNESGFSFDSLTDGDVEFGDANSGTVNYIVADDYLSQTSGNLFGTLNMAMNGTMHICDGCSNPEDAESDLELKAFFEMDMAFDGERFIMAMGNSLQDMLSVQSSGVAGGAGTHEINGRMKAERPGTDCSFDATYETIQPMVTQNTFTENESVVSGELDVTIAGGGTHRVVIAGGVVSVDGVTFTEEDLEALETDCEVGVE